MTRIALVAVAAFTLAACANPQPRGAVAVGTDGTTGGAVAVESNSPRNSNVSTTVAVGTNGGGVAVGTGNLTVGVGTGGRRGFGMWF